MGTTAQRNRIFAKVWQGLIQRDCEDAISEISGLSLWRDRTQQGIIIEKPFNLYADDRVLDSIIPIDQYAQIIG